MNRGKFSVHVDTPLPCPVLEGEGHSLTSYTIPVRYNRGCCSGSCPRVLYVLDLMEAGITASRGFVV